MWDFNNWSGKIAMYDEYGNKLDYKELEQEGQKIANVVGRRCLVFILCVNKIGAMVGYTAFINNNIVPVLFNANIEKEMLDNLIIKYKPSFIWIPEEQKKIFSEYENVYHAWDYNLLKTNFNTEYKLYPELCLMLTTSGSTGSPKFVRQSYVNVKANADSIVKYLNLDYTEKPITTLPMNYTYGLSIINSHFLVGATLLVTSRDMLQKEFWDFFKKQEATSFGGVPYTYEILERLKFIKMDLPSLRYMTQAGGKITTELQKKFAQYANKNDKKFIVMYGQCEATARMGYLPAEKSLDKCGSMGIAIPGGKFYLIDTDGKYINEPNITGELVYEGDNVTLGYAESGEDLVKGDEHKGVLYTGDMAWYDDDGFYYIAGRKKRFLKIYGNRVNLDEVDRLIKNKFENIDIASAGVDDHMYLFITEKNLIRDIKKFIVEKTKLNPAAFKIITVNEIPKNDSGKVLYVELEKYYKNILI